MIQKKIIRLYILAILMIPILFQYSSGISSITIGDIFLLVTFLLVILSKRRSIRFTPILLSLFLYIFFHMLIYILIIVDYNKSTMFTTIRYLFYLFNSIIFASVIDEKKYAEKIYIRIGFISSIYLFIQIALINIKGYYLSGVIGYLKLTDSSLYTYDSVINSAQVKRVMSFFAEPAHFATYVLGCLVIVLFKDKNIDKKNIFISLIMSLAIILSTSITGILTLILIWTIWLFINIFENKINWKFILLVSLIILGVYALSDTQAIRYATNSSVFQRQSMGRFKGYGYILENFNNYNTLNLLFGYGMKDIGYIIYLSGFPRMYYYFGIIGSLMYCTVFLSLFRRNSRINKLLILIVLVLSTGTEMLFGPFILQYLLFIILYRNTEYREKLL